MNNLYIIPKWLDLTIRMFPFVILFMIYRLGFSKKNKRKKKRSWVRKLFWIVLVAILLFYNYIMS